MEFRILGSLDVVDDGSPIVLSGRPRALLAFFLLHPNELVPTERLIDAVWGERPPETAQAALQVHISKLRRALGPDRIRTRAPGYLFRLEPHELDAARFELLLAEGRVRDALALWRGPALAEYRYEPWAASESARLDELRLAAVEERIDADLARGDHARLVSELEALVREEPLRERLRARLMLALYRCGRQAEALAQYQETRRLLVEELGIEPGDELKSLHRRMLNHDRTLVATPSAGGGGEPPAPREERVVIVLSCGLGGSSSASTWSRVPRETMRRQVAEYRYLAESLAAQYGCLHREWAGESHTFLFENADAAAQFGLRLIESWKIAASELPTLRSGPRPPIRIGCHLGEWIPIDAEDWIVRGSSLARRLEGEAEEDSLCVTEHLLDLLDLPLYELELVGTASLEGDHLPERRLYRIAAFKPEALQARPREELSAEDWFLRGVALVGTPEENGEAEAEAYREALALRPDYAEAHVNYAVLLRARGRAAEAAHHYQEALRLRPEYPEAHYNYAAMLAGRGSVTGAAEHYREALRLRPEYVDAHHGYATLLAQQGELDAAAEHYRRALALRPDYPEAHNNCAILLELRGQTDEAVEHYREALRLRPSYPQAHYNLALLLESRGDTAAAEAHYRRAVELWPDYGEAHNNLAILLQLKGDLDTAEEHYRRALRTRPDDPETHYNYGLLLRVRGDETAATRHLRTAYELAPERSVFRSALEGQ